MQTAVRSHYPRKKLSIVSSSRRSANVGSVVNACATSDASLPKIILTARRWMDLSCLDRDLVRLEFQTAQAYSVTGRITDW